MIELKNGKGDKAVCNLFIIALYNACSRAKFQYPFIKVDHKCTRKMADPIYRGKTVKEKENVTFA
jgi:hypothetical protein